MSDGETQVPFTFSGDWPEATPGSMVVAREAGITLGSVALNDRSWAEMRSGQVVSIRIDEHPVTDGWVTRHPDGYEETRTFVIPTEPEPVPSEVLVSQRSLEEWVWDIHGATGRLLLWDDSREWWLLNEPDLELTLISAPEHRFMDEFQKMTGAPFAWVKWVNPSNWTDWAKGRLADIAARYGLGTPDSAP
jgi:hypothetical protein